MQASGAGVGNVRWTFRGMHSHSPDMARKAAFDLHNLGLMFSFFFIISPGTGAESESESESIGCTTVRFIIARSDWHSSSELLMNGKKGILR